MDTKTACSHTTGKENIESVRNIKIATKLENCDMEKVTVEICMRDKYSKKIEQ